MYTMSEKRIENNAVPVILIIKDSPHFVSTGICRCETIFASLRDRDTYILNCLMIYYIFNLQYCLINNLYPLKVAYTLSTMFADKVYENFVFYLLISKRQMQLFMFVLLLRQCLLRKYQCQSQCHQMS